MRSGTLITLTLSDEALEALNSMASNRKRGDLVTKLILSAHQRGEGVGKGVLERIETKIDKLLALTEEK